MFSPIIQGWGDNKARPSHHQRLPLRAMRLKRQAWLRVRDGLVVVSSIGAVAWLYDYLANPTTKNFRLHPSLPLTQVWTFKASMLFVRWALRRRTHTCEHLRKCV